MLSLVLSDHPAGIFQMGIERWISEAGVTAPSKLHAHIEGSATILHVASYDIPLATTKSLTKSLANNIIMAGPVLGLNNSLNYSVILLTGPFMFWHSYKIIIM